MKRHPYSSFELAGGRLVLSVLLTLALFGGPLASSAHAGFFDQVKSFIQLPGQVDSLKEQYDYTKQQLDDATRQLDTVTRQSREALEQYRNIEEQYRQTEEQYRQTEEKFRQTEEQYRQSEQRLKEENERLARQNDHLSQAVESLQQAERDRAAKSKRTWIMIWTGIGLVAFYFLSGRLFRLTLRSRQT